MPPTIPDDHPIVLFDGVCNLCTGTVRFVIPRDPQGTVYFASLQSSVGQELLARFDLAADEFDSFVLVEGDRHYTKSTAALRIAKYLGGAYAWLSLLRVIPRGLRDAVYDVVSNHRYQWFGRRKECMVPGEDVRSRFLE